MSQSRIEELVYAGNVLDERGNWIPIADKIRKERVFLNHLENGEVFTGEMWVTLSSLKQMPPADTVETETTIANNIVQAREYSYDTNTSDIPEETISISTSQLSEHISRSVPAHEIDYPPETAVLKIETGPDATLTYKTTDPFYPDHVYVDEDSTHLDLPVWKKHESVEKPSSQAAKKSEYEETVLYSIKSIQEQIDKKNTNAGNSRKDIK